MTTTVIFVHGACVRDADWWWSRMTQPLTERGIATLAVPLPSCGETGDTLGDLADDVRACRRAVADVDGPVVLCGHSYGGMVITEAGADERVTHLVYVTSVMPDTGQSQAELIGAEPAPWLQPGEDTVGVDPQMIRDSFLQDCDPATTEAAVARLTRQALAHHAVDLHRVHRGSRHAARGAAPTRTGGDPACRVRRRTPSLPLTTRRICTNRRRSDQWRSSDDQLKAPNRCSIIAGSRSSRSSPGATVSHMEIGVRDLRNRTAVVIDAVTSGERVTLTVRGEPIADIVPHGQRARWLGGASLREQLEQRSADAQLTVELDVLAGDTLDQV
jgi:prevent-host-death family protein